MKQEKTVPHLSVLDEARQKTADALYVALANTVVLSVKTQFCHWNVTGMSFSALHALFETQYHGLTEVIDELAERIRQLGFWVDGSLAGYQNAATLTEMREPLSADKMVGELAADHQSMVKLINQSIDALETMNADRTSIDLLQSRLPDHEKNAWLLNSHLA